MLRFVLLSFLFFQALIIWAGNPEKPSIFATRTDETIEIDGLENEAVWTGLPVAQDFTELEPVAGSKSSYRTEVKIVYSDIGLYVFGKMYCHPDSLIVRMTPRDFNRNVDWFSIILDTYGNGTNGYAIGVTAAGVQFDVLYTSNGEDNSWNPVWESAVVTTDEGWQAEFFIPYRALRFAEAERQEWGLNFGRNAEYTRETSFWSEVDPTVDGFLIQCGRLLNIEDITSPLRLSLFPFVVGNTSVFYDADEGVVSDVNTEVSGGADLKWGINEAFTLDMTLIPDFSQARSDNQILNLSPFEVRFSEQRQFFQEGVELFDRGNVFFSRRIGGNLFYQDRVLENLSGSESIIDQPTAERILNVTKITGRNQKGLGLGVLNAITDASYATIRDEDGSLRTELINPFTNYSVFVVDQNLKNNSYASLINTNVWRSGSAYEANVTATEFDLRDKENRFGISGSGALSQQFLEEGNNIGHRAQLELGKISGKFRYGVNYSEISSGYNPNDLGIQFFTNIREVGGELVYEIPDPKDQKLSRVFHYFRTDASFLYDQGAYENYSMFNRTFVLTKNFLGFGRSTFFQPWGRHDYFEPRTGDFSIFLDNPGYLENAAFISTNYSKTFALDLDVEYGKFFEPGRHRLAFEIGPRWRISDKALLILESFISDTQNDVGYVKPEEEGQFYDQIDPDRSFMSRRDVRNISNTLTLDYSITPYLNINFRSRHNWTKLNVKDVFQLETDGSLTDIPYNGKSPSGQPVNDFNFNVFNIDLMAIWRFAPGSDLIFVWKNAISSDDLELGSDYWNNLGNTLGQSQLNTFSLKAVYFLDYYLLTRNKGV